MTTETAIQTAGINRLDDYEAISKVVQLYIDGAGAADVGKLKQAFHDSAWMFGNIFGHRYDMAIGDFYEFVSATPPPGGDYRARIASIDIALDAGVATLVEENYLGMDFVDYFAVAKFDGQWKITNKTFATTGGTPPPM